ncbi:D-TA family PLP-dependent enzyme [Pelagibacterium xiamenense]|uniref:D-TA family PLP-dependent enzyme n=1 Tax=Pelagibacterium xiamenense TaxID=2901140 RepID=UPI001E2F53D0|nr:D-TA family PLP-dependent enzyme [Pelagibacterium xiamenense]MCD7059141.1 D-TA family PLP-dependent enzyme [Pelagibacterium xiamenense]
MTVGTSILDLSTPVPVIDEAVVAANIARVQDYMDAHGIAFRPHIKTHKLPALAGAQRDAGASGINCQKISEAEVFADAGFEDILITFNILGAEKTAPLAALNARTNLKVVADSLKTVEGLAAAFSADRPLTVLVECDTGGGRCGVQTPTEALALAQAIAAAPGLRFGGVLTYPRPSSEDTVEAFFSATRAALAQAGIDCPVVSTGGTPSLFSAHKVPSATEYRAGTYIYNDRAMVRAGHAGLDRCAMHVLATVVSRPAENRAVLDSGSKALTSDLLGFDDYGLIVDYPDARITTLSEEHAVVDLSACGKKPRIGDKLRIIPNHTCVVSNMFDAVVFHRDGVVTRTLPVAARGRVW